jgi:hypothetical protein
MVQEKEQRAIGAFASRADVESALNELKAANFPMEKVSVIARNAEQDSDIAGVEVKEHADNKSDEGATVGAVTGGAVGGLTGLLVGLGLLAIPGIGPIMLAGASGTALATALAGSAIGAAAGSLGGALIGIGIPEDRANIYSDLVSEGYYLVIIEGTEAETNAAERILGSRGIQEWGVYEMSPNDSLHYKYAAGIFFKLADAESALKELKKSGFKMNQVFVIAKNASPYKSLAGVDIRSPEDKFDILGIPDAIIKDYEYRISIGDYPVIIYGSDADITSAKAILDSHRVEDFRIYNLPVDMSKLNADLAGNRT